MILNIISNYSEQSNWKTTPCRNIIKHENKKDFLLIAKIENWFKYWTKIVSKLNRFSISFEIEKQFKLRLKFNLILDWTTISSSRTYSYYHTGIWDCFTILFYIVFRSHLSLKINLLSNRFSIEDGIENRFESHLKSCLKSCL